MKRYWLKWTGVATLAFALAACGTDDGNNDGASSEQNGETEGPASEETFTIGATQILEHPSLDAAYEGFKQAIADAGLEVEFDFQSAQNDQNNASAIANNFVANQVDLIFANSTPSAQSALQATNDIPILFTSVTNAVEGGLVSAMDEPGENITGVVDLHPDAIENTVHFMDEYFSDAKVGIVYNAGEANSVAQMDEIAVAAEETTLELVSRTVASSSEVQQAVSSLVSEVDILYVFTDNTVVSALETVISEANSAEIPLIVGEPDSLARGGFATFGIDYHTLGYRTGEMAVDVLTGNKTTADIPVEYPGSDMQLIINKEAAENQGVEWNDEWDDIAEFYEGE